MGLTYSEMELANAGEIYLAQRVLWEELDVVILPSEPMLVVNPTSPDLAKNSLKKVNPILNL